MPIEPVLQGWVQDHPEARAIYRSAHNFRSDRELAKKLAVFPARPTVTEWEEDVRANCERGWPADWIERKYVPPDWKKVYPLLGDPPVWSTEDIEAYTALLNGFTEMLEPRDQLELILTKEAAMQLGKRGAWPVKRTAWPSGNTSSALKFRPNFRCEEAPPRPPRPSRQPRLITAAVSKPDLSITSPSI
jgi:hypothetical protein